VDVAKDVPSVHGDPRRVDQILINLLGNAVKYTPDTGSVVVAAQVNEATHMVEVSVTDNGIGIPADMLPIIFDRYSRIERTEVRRTVGTGLGLSIAKALVNAHGGEIWVASEEGYGSTFTFTLPPSEQLDAGTESTATSAPQAK
jgi:signal transduction histidine kinase